MRQLVVEETFDISGRGAAVVFRGSPEGLPLGRVFSVFVQRPDGSTIQAQATVEFFLRRQPQPSEHAALLLKGIAKSAVPSMSIVRVVEELID